MQTPTNASNPPGTDLQPHSPSTTVSADSHLALDILIATWLRTLDVAPKTATDYRKVAIYFAEWITTSETNLDDSCLRRYRDHLLARGLSPLSVGTYLSAVQRFLRFLHNNNAITTLPSARRPASTRRHQRDVIPPETLRATLTAIDLRSLIGLRDYTLLVLLAHAGLRTCEIVTALVGDVRTTPRGPIALWVQGKGHSAKDEPVYLEPPVIQPMREYFARRARRLQRNHLSDDAPLFAVHGHRNTGRTISRRTIRHIVANRLDAVGGKTPRTTAHSFRHTAATQALLAGAPIQQVRDMLRHKQLETTMIYAHNLDREQNRAERFIDYGIPTPILDSAC